MPSDTQAEPARLSPGPGIGALGLVLPTFPQETAGLPDAPELARVCTDAEAAGAGALWACDHLFWHGPALETMSALGLAASATSRAFVGSCVLQLPLRGASAVAKEAAGLQHLSGGRLVLGVGAGMHRGEYEAAGAEFALRGRRLDESIDALKELWSTNGDERYAQLPVPDPIPVWVGGSSEAALRRAASRGDGWIPLFLAPDEYTAALARLDKEADRAGRDPAEITRAIVLFMSCDDAAQTGLEWMSSLYGLPARAFARHLVAGGPRQCSAVIARYLEAGAQHVAVFLTTDHPSEQFAEVAGELHGRLR